MSLATDHMEFLEWCERVLQRLREHGIYQPLCLEIDHQRAEVVFTAEEDFDFFLARLEQLEAGTNEDTGTPTLTFREGRITYVLDLQVPSTRTYWHERRELHLTERRRELEQSFPPLRLVSDDDGSDP